MKKGTQVKIKATGVTGTIADFNSKLVNVTIDEKHLGPGDDKQVYLKHDEIEEVKEEAAATATEETKTETAVTQLQTSEQEGADFLQKLVESLQARVKELETENEKLKLYQHGIE
jgi:hypothetical protein